MNLLIDYQKKFELFLKDLEKSKKIILPKELRGLKVELPPKNQKGDFACNAAMILSKLNSSNPLDLANLIKSEVMNYFPEVSYVEVAKPGFINLTFDANFWRECLNNEIALKDTYGSKKSDKKKYNIEFVSANPTGPLHVGHCRGAILGDVIANLLIFNGNNVTKEYYVNDYGSQINHFVKSVYCRILEITSKIKFPENKDLYPGGYIIEIAKKIISTKTIKNFDNYEAIFPTLKKESLRHSLIMIKGNLSILGINHDNFVKESDLIKDNVVKKAIENLKKQEFVYEGKLNPPKGEAVTSWKSRSQLLFKSTLFGDDTDRSLQKEDKTWTYFAGDIGYHSDKIKRNFDILINILGADHAGYIKRISAATKAISNQKTNLICKVSQLVKLFKNGIPFKMSKRKGDYITVQDLVDEVGKDSVRFMMLNRSNDVELDFDFKKVTEKSKDNPVFYVQYAYARINSIFRMLNMPLKGELKVPNNDFNINSHEIEILKKIAEWPKCIDITFNKLEPHIIPFYLYEISTLFHSYWNLGNENKDFRFVKDNKSLNNSRLLILQALAIVLENGMSILGVSTPESM